MKGIQSSGIWTFTRYYLCSALYFNIVMDFIGNRILRVYLLSDKKAIFNYLCLLTKGGGSSKIRFRLKLKMDENLLQQFD